MAHRFKDTNFSRPTYCEGCQGLLWGLVRQGSKCEGCGAVSHVVCQSNVARCSNPVTKKPVAWKSIQPLPTGLKLPTAEKSQYEQVGDIIVSAALHSADPDIPVNDYLANLPPLSGQNTGKNFVRFSSRCGPMFAFRDSVILLLSWDKPIDTLTAMIVYCFVCLYPKLLLLVPHIILLQIIISGYQKREQEQVTSYRFGIFPVSENSPEYGRNMQNLQNMMGEMSDLYDLVAANAHYFDWSSEAQTMRIFQATIISFFVMSLTIWFIPIQPILLVGGIAMFLINTKFAKYLLQELPQKLSDKKKTESPADKVLTWYDHTEKVLVNQDKMQEIAVYENQRYSYETGFGTKLLHHERKPWSNFSGTSGFETITNILPPKGYNWLETNWVLDKSCPWVHDKLDIEIMVTPDKDGWVYTSTHWDISNGNLDDKSNNNYTRRRRWIRKCKKM